MNLLSRSIAQINLSMSVLRITVKPVLRGQFLTKKQWLYKTGDLLKEVPYEIVYDMTSQK